MIRRSCHRLNRQAAIGRNGEGLPTTVTDSLLGQVASPVLRLTTCGLLHFAGARREEEAIACLGPPCLLGLVVGVLGGGVSLLG